MTTKTKAAPKTSAVPRRRSARNAPELPPEHQVHVGTWHGIPNYLCPYCPFAVLDTDGLDGEALVVAHIAELHRQQAIESAQKEF